VINNYYLLKNNIKKNIHTWIFLSPNNIPYRVRGQKLFAIWRIRRDMQFESSARCSKENREISISWATVTMFNICLKHEGKGYEGEFYRVFLNLFMLSASEAWSMEHLVQTQR
jgi:hypothetical protein